MMEPEIKMSLDDAHAVIKDLQQHEICPRCILRVIGVKTQWAYRQPDKTLADYVSKAIKVAANKDKPDKEDTGTSDKTDSNKPISQEDTGASADRNKEEPSSSDNKEETSTGGVSEMVTMTDGVSSDVKKNVGDEAVAKEDAEDITDEAVANEDAEDITDEAIANEDAEDITDKDVATEDVVDITDEVVANKEDAEDITDKAVATEDVVDITDEVVAKKEDAEDITNEAEEKSMCGLCLGILQGLCERECAQRIGDQIISRDYQFSSFMMAVTLPLGLLIRENCLVVHMSEKLKSFDKIPSIKEVYKWVAGPQLGEALDVHFHPKSPFDVMVSLKHDESEKEVELLLEKYGIITTASTGEPPRKKQKFPPKRRKMKSYHAADVAPTRSQVLKAITEMSTKFFKELFPCPPKGPSLPCAIEVMCSHGSIYIAGRYMKYSRHLSQSPWVVDGHRKTESSVEELICEYTKAKLNAEDYRFSSSGREDVDVRTLGRGRPFVVEFLNPRISSLSVEQLKEITQIVNGRTKEVKIRDLQMISRDQTAKLKQGEEEKTKSYSALIWVEKEIKEDDIKFLADIKELMLKQKTPIRVLHRRPLATRERLVHSMTYEFIDSHHFKLCLNTQAGTYIKEFVHGDFGRTLPNLGTLLKTDADILELDVEAVNVDWPPTIETD